MKRVLFSCLLVAVLLGACSQSAPTEEMTDQGIKPVVTVFRPPT